jgi:hypothetical protein
MSKFHWPDNTASPEPGGTHLVVKGDRAHPKTWQFLLIPSNPDMLPSWIDAREKAGIWSQHDAERLVKMHSRWFCQLSRQKLRTEQFSFEFAGRVVCFAARKRSHAL